MLATPMGRARYTIGAAIRASMAASGYVPGGYGPNGVSMYALECVQVLDAGYVVVRIEIDARGRTIAAHHPLTCDPSPQEAPT